jgi:hypothetical protein
LRLPSSSRRAALGAALFGVGAFVSGGEAKAAADDTGALNVRSVGAKGDGIADDTAALQAAINSCRSLIWPAGTYRITDTLRFPSTAPPGGGYWYGDGMSVTNPQIGARKGPHTTLLWDGGADGTLLEWSGLGGWRFENMSFVGRPSARSVNRAAILIHCKMHPTLGAAGYTFRNVSAWDADVCIQFGTVASDTNCDSVLFERLVLGYATRGVVVKNDQGLLYQFVALGAGWVTTVIDLEHGGHLLVNQAAFHACGGPGPDDFCIRLRRMEANAQTAILNDVRVESGTKRVLQASRASGRIQVNGFNEAQVDQKSVMFATEGPTIEFNSSRFFSHGDAEPAFALVQGGGGHKPAMIFRACSFAVPDFRIDDWFDIPRASYAGVMLDACTYKATQERLPLINNVAEWADVTHFARTQGTTPRYAYFDGGDQATRSNTVAIPRDSTWAFDVFVIARSSDADVSAAFHRRFLIQDRGGTTRTAGALQVVGADQNPGGYAVAIDVRNGLVRTLVTGAAGQTVDWHVRYAGRPVGIP